METEITFEPLGSSTTVRVSHVPWVYVGDVEAHFSRAQDGGAVIVQPLAAPWGLPMYVAEDLEGYRWTFAQARPTI